MLLVHSKTIKCQCPSRVPFQVVGLKCMECGSYNTSREGEEGVPVAALPLPQASHAPQDDEEWETEDEKEIVRVHKETEPEEQDADNDLVNLAQVQLNLGDETDDNQIVPALPKMVDMTTCENQECPN